MRALKCRFARRRTPVDNKLRKILNLGIGNRHLVLNEA